MAQLYAASPSGGFSVADLEGYQPAGTGKLWSDAAGPRVSQIQATGLAHAWPAGSGSGPDKSYVSPKHVNYAWYLADFFSTRGPRQRLSGETGADANCSQVQSSGSGARGQRPLLRFIDGCRCSWSAAWTPARPRARWSG